MVKIAQQIPFTANREVYLAVATTLPHIAEVATNLLDWVSDEDLLYPLNGLVKFYHGQGLYGQGVDWAEKCLQVLRDRLGQDHPDVATSLNNLANLYRAQGRYSEAEPLYQQALEIDCRAIGEDHPGTAIDFVNLAGLYTTLQRYSEAEPLYLHALEVFLDRLGKAHPYTQTTYRGLVNLIAEAVQAGRESELSDHPGVQDLVRQMREKSK